MEGPIIIDLPKIMDERGNLSFIENSENFPFKIARAFWTYDVPGGQQRGAHAYKESKELIVALSGSFDVVIDTIGEKQTYSLNRSYYGLYVPNLLWKHLENFSTNALCLTLSSTQFDAADYIRDFDEYKLIRNGIGK